MYQHQNIEELAPQILELLQLGESEDVEFKSAKVGLPKDFGPRIPLLSIPMVVS